MFDPEYTKFQLIPPFIVLISVTESTSIYPISLSTIETDLLNVGNPVYIILQSWPPFSVLRILSELKQIPVLALNILSPYKLFPCGNGFCQNQPLCEYRSAIIKRWRAKLKKRIFFILESISVLQFLPVFTNANQYKIRKLLITIAVIFLNLTDIEKKIKCNYLPKISVFVLEVKVINTWSQTLSGFIYN